MEVTDGIEQDCSTSELTDIENESEEELCCVAESASTGEHVERRGLKREYDGMCVDIGGAAAVLQPERRLRSRLQEQFALLRAAVPNLSTDERASILTGAYEYIARLKREEAELRCELGEGSSSDEEELSCCEDEGSCSSTSSREAEERAVESDSATGWSKLNGSDCGCSSQLTSVEVVRTGAGLRIHIECGMRPGLLLAIMELLESSRLTMEEATVECVERLVFDGIGLEDVEGICEDGKTSNVSRMSAEFLGARLRSLIGDHRHEGSTV